MGKRISYVVAVLLLFLWGSCRDPFEPEVTNADISLLVVEGYIETNGEESTIYISKTNPIRSGSATLPVIDASVFLISSTGEEWSFSETDSGTYSYTGFFDIQDTYQLGINLTNGKQYLSEPMKPIVTPEINELNFLRDEAGVEIFISTKGTDEAQYFLWDYEEHWIFRPGVISFLKFENGAVSKREPDERIDLCWSSNIFPKIILQNSARFADNTIIQRELVRIPNESEKLTQRYSIKVRQRAIDQATYDFWEILRKNSDDIGGIFSPLPSLIGGNIKAISPETDNAIGYVSIGQSASQRIYIDYEDVQPWRIFIPEYEFCFVLADTIPPNEAVTAFNNIDRVPAREVFDGMFFLGYRAATKKCTDCTLRGTNRAPGFWED
ncbi:DUF4249 domain-containing protein [Aquiflexum sp. LQ15W]|uniref:DUF4249 domain-containing protein n=1 Tax=Cognataquiflexum nitidum TaxID=2922272 RepID=UPI001F142C54|nr:DUF4249 domain-containing protein [Cognataquiflexum nitidum]MCH6198031.1 DUF4249 domain-containing protein [Cognataquiflexum nitidum]